MIDFVLSLSLMAMGNFSLFWTKMLHRMARSTAQVSIMHVIMMMFIRFLMLNRQPLALNLSLERNLVISMIKMEIE